MANSVSPMTVGFSSIITVSIGRCNSMYITVELIKGIPLWDISRCLYGRNWSDRNRNKKAKVSVEEVRAAHKQAPEREERETGAESTVAGAKKHPSART